MPRVYKPAEKSVYLCTDRKEYHRPYRILKNWVRKGMDVSKLEKF